MYYLGKASRSRLVEVHPDLIILAARAISITSVDFTITGGIRTQKRQNELVKSGASKTLNSRHLSGHAIDVAALMDGRVSWDWPLYYLINDAFKQASIDTKIPFVWGGDWKSFKDGPHYELPWKYYPL